MQIVEYERFVARMLTWPANFAQRIARISHRARFTLALAEELGEYCGKLKRYLRGDYEHLEDFRQAELKELGDILFYVTSLANAAGFTLAEVMAENRNKLEDRAQRGTIKGTGDNR